MKKIAIVTGGFSKESMISIESGKLVYNSLCKERYIPYIINISKKKWIMIYESKEYKINKQDFSVLLENGKKLIFDCIFNVIHGSPGEDGMLPAYFELLEIPYTGCNFHKSNITFNKNYCISILKSFGINVAKSYCINIKDTFCKSKIIKKIGIPCFIKPNKSGSSLGISKVNKKSDFESAIKCAFQEDNEILIESYLKGKEISVGVIALQKQNINVLPITEIISKNEFFDFESKYSGQSNEITPANLKKDLENKIINITKKIHNIFDIDGISRSEYIIVNEEPFFLEINTIPGLSKHSIFPKQLKVANISLSDIFNKLIKQAIIEK